MSEWFSGIKAKFILDFIADQRWKYITDGLKVTLEVTFLALILGLVLGAVIAVIRTTHDQLKEDQMGEQLTIQPQGPFTGGK